MRINITDKMLNDIKKNNDTSRSMITDLTGLSVAVRGGARGVAIHFQCKVQKNGKRTVYVLGKYPEMSLTDARSKFLKFISDIEKGISPVKKEETESNDLTVGEVWEKFCKYKFVELQEKTKKKYVSLWSSHLCLMKDILLKDLTPKSTMQLVKPHVDKGAYDTAKRITSALRALVDYAVFLEELPFNPITRINNYIPNPKRKHIATFSDDTMDLDLEQLFFNMSDCSKVNQFLLYMYFFTLLRSKELRTLKISDVHGDYITVKTKTMEKFKQPLSSQAQRVIEYLIAHKTTKSEYIFEGMAELGYISEYTLNKALDAHGYRDKLRVHGIRSCGRQWLQELPNAKESVIELCLSHTVGNVVQQAYNRGEYVEEKRKLLQAFSDYIVEKSKGNFEKLFID